MANILFCQSESTSTNFRGTDGYVGWGGGGFGWLTMMVPTSGGPTEMMMGVRLMAALVLKTAPLVSCWLGTGCCRVEYATRLRPTWAGGGGVPRSYACVGHMPLRQELQALLKKEVRPSCPDIEHLSWELTCRPGIRLAAQRFLLCVLRN